MNIIKIDAGELKRRLESGERMQLIDVRSPREYSEAHLPGAVNMPIEEVDARLDDMHSQDPVVLVCQSGNRACMAHSALKQHRDDLIVLEGGTTGWQKAGFDVIRATAATLPLMRQVQLVVGPLSLIGSVMALVVDPAWALLSGLIGLGLTIAGATGFCGMASLLGLLPWNRSVRNNQTKIGATP